MADSSHSKDGQSNTPVTSALEPASIKSELEPAGMFGTSQLPTQECSYGASSSQVSQLEEDEASPSETQTPRSRNGAPIKRVALGDQNVNNPCSEYCTCDSASPTTRQIDHSSSALMEQSSNDAQPACGSSKATDAKVEELGAVAIPSHSHCDQRYCQASVCNSFCTCEPYEEMTDMYETEESMPVSVPCHVLSESENGPSDYVCSCDDDVVIVRPLYAIHCCSCGVHLGHGCELFSDPPEEGFVPEEGRPGPSGREGSIPVPPPPPSDHLMRPRLAPLAASRRDRNGARDSRQSIRKFILHAGSRDEGAEFDSRLHEAARAGSAEKLAALLEEDASRARVNSRVKPLMATPLREAVVGGNDECVRMLLAAGADVDAIDIKAQTPLFVAASLGRAAILETLLKAGADPEGSRCNNCTPLLLAVREGCVDAVKLLLRHGVDPEPLSVLRTCTPGWPLQHSVVYRRLHCFLELLRGGAEPSLLALLTRGGQSDADVDERILWRLSIVRSVLQYASDMPEFITVFREFGGPVEHISSLPDGLRLSSTPARQELQDALDIPMRLTSLCRIRLLRAVGAPQLPALAAEFGLPSPLQAFLAFADLDKRVAAAYVNMSDSLEP